MPFGMSWLDYKLGFRMLVRYPMLTLVAGLAMAVAIGAGAGTFEVIERATSPTLPLPDGERIVGLNYWDRVNSSPRPMTSYDFLKVRAGLKTLEDIGAFRLAQRNLNVHEDAGPPIEVAEVSAAAFRITRVPPLLGRTLTEADENAASPAVVVLGYRLWQARFGGDAKVLGRIVRLGETQATVVGVMPEGYAFPVRHNLWTQLRLGDLPRTPAEGIALRVFGRLAPGFSLSLAQAEVATFSARLAAQFPEEYANLNPQVLPYPQSLMPIPADLLVGAGLSMNAFAGLFLAVVCGNVALLMFARAAAREREILVRRALGAPRSRIVAQLFAEALVISSFAAVFGLAATNAGLKWTLAALSGEGNEWPFWLQGGLSASTLAYSALLTIVAAALAGVVPGLKVTKRQMESGLREASAGMAGLRMGGVWTAAIVAQIAVSVLFTAVAYVAQRQAAGIASAKTSFPANEYLAAQVKFDEEGSQSATSENRDSQLKRYLAIVRQLEERIAAQPQIAAVTFAGALPMLPQGGGRIELDGDSETGSSHRGPLVTRADVDVNFFQVFQTPTLAGRGFTPQDAIAGSSGIVVNEMFVERVLAGRNALGRRIRFKVSNAQSQIETSQWFEIIGVVRNLVLDSNAPLSLDNPARPAVYHALGSRHERAYPLYLALRVKGQAKSAEPILRRAAADLNPQLRITDVQRLDEGKSSDAQAWNALANTITAVSAVALLLSLAGIYAITSFTVSRRTREIAVRAALGAPASRIILSVFGRPMMQAGGGVFFGCVLVGMLVAFFLRNVNLTAGAMLKHIAVLLSYGTAMMAVCVFACTGPILRVLRVQPSDVLRDDG